MREWELKHIIRSEAPEPVRPAIGRVLANARFRRLFWQIIAVIVLASAFAWMHANFQHNLKTRAISSGFGFLSSVAGVPIAEHLTPYQPTDSNLRALVAGAVNTLWVAGWGILFSTVLGVSVGIARLSKNWLLSTLASVYVEFFRSIPLLLQLLLWYAIMQKLPPVKRALEPISGLVLSSRGLSFPSLVWEAGHVWAALALAVGVVASAMLARNMTKKRLADGKHRITWPFAIVLLVLVPMAVSFFFGTSYNIVMPKVAGFNVRGGTTISPEFFALLVGLVVYNGTFIAEIVRSGLLSVGTGQHEAARALGLRPNSTLKWIVFPQALRVIIPPLTSQYLSLLKSSSLAVAIGYQDLVSVANTIMNQDGHAVEIVAIIMAVYLTFSLSISLIMNIYNSRMALRER